MQIRNAGDGDDSSNQENSETTQTTRSVLRRGKTRKCNRKQPIDHSQPVIIAKSGKGEPLTMVETAIDYVSWKKMILGLFFAKAIA